MLRHHRTSRPDWLVAAVALAFAGMLILGVLNAVAGETAQKGNLRVHVEGDLSPHRLPRKGFAPISVSVGGSISTTDKTTPPQLRKLTIEINRHGHFDFQGLPVCKVAQIQPASNSAALSACRSSLVGNGSFTGSISLPGSDYPLQGRLLLFNGRSNGQPVLLGHVFSAKPFFTSFVIVFTIANKPHGNYGTVLTADLAKTLKTRKSLTAIDLNLGRRYRYRGRQQSYLSAGCPAPKGLSVPFPLVRTKFSFAGGSKFDIVVTRVCKAVG